MEKLPHWLDRESPRKKQRHSIGASREPSRASQAVKIRGHDQLVCEMHSRDSGLAEQLAEVAIYRGARAAAYKYTSTEERKGRGIREPLRD